MSKHSLFGCAYLFATVLIAAGIAAAEPKLLPLRAGTELFVDDANLARKAKVTRTVHAARKLPQPVLKGDNGAPVRIYGTVYRNPENGEFRMWYGRSYATSKDGLHWEKPAFDLFKVRGKPTNIVLPKGGGGVLVDEIEPDPGKRYKALLAEPFKVGGFSGYYSADGIHWTRYGNDRLFEVGSEVGHVMRDPATRKYFAYIRPYASKHFPKNVKEKRLGAVLTSEDFVNWSGMKVVLAPDALDDAWVKTPEQRTEFYAMSGFAYGRSYLGVVPVFRIERIVDKTEPTQSRYDGPMEGQLISSRDGLNWSRLENRAPVLPSGREYDISIMNVAAAPLIVDDEIWHYYTAISTTHGAPSPQKQITIALARWRLDGYVSLDAGEDEGVVETTVIEAHNGGLEINAAAGRGSVLVEVLNPDGTAIPGYVAADCAVISTDAVRHRVRWAGTDRLPENQAFRLRFRFSNASLFSYTLVD